MREKRNDPSVLYEERSLFRLFQKHPSMVRLQPILVFASLFTVLDF